MIKNFKSNFIVRLPCQKCEEKTPVLDVQDMMRCGHGKYVVLQLSYQPKIEKPEFIKRIPITSMDSIQKPAEFNLLRNEELYGVLENAIRLRLGKEGIEPGINFVSKNQLSQKYSVFVAAAIHDDKTHQGKITAFTDLAFEEMMSLFSELSWTMVRQKKDGGIPLSFQEEVFYQANKIRKEHGPESFGSNQPTA